MNFISYISSFFTSFHIVDSIDVDVPNYLLPIEHTMDWILGLIAMFSIVIVTLSKKVEPNIFYLLIQTLFSVNTPDRMLKSERSIDTSGVWLLVFNFFVSTSLCVLLMNYQPINSKFVFNLELPHLNLSVFSSLLLVNTYLLVNLFLWFYLLYWITGEKKVFNTYLTQTRVSMMHFGVLFLLIGLIWFLNPLYNKVLLSVFLYSFLAFYLTRLIKIIISSIEMNINWHYLILYLCTLEILPIVMFYYYLV